jgi:hypothetical protein
MSLTQKPNAQVNQGNAIVQSFNNVDKSLSTSGFLIAKSGRKITQTISTTNVSNDTLLFDHLEDGVSLYVLKVIYTDGTRTELLSAERIS